MGAGFLLRSDLLGISTQAPRSAPHLRQDRACTAHICTGTLSASAPPLQGLGSPLPRLGSRLRYRLQDWAHPLPRLRRDWAHPCTSAPGLGSPLSRRCRDWAHPLPRLRQDWAHPCLVRSAKKCFDIMQDALPQPVGEAYMHAALSPATTKAVAAMLSQLRRAFELELSSASVRRAPPALAATRRVASRCVVATRLTLSRVRGCTVDGCAVACRRTREASGDDIQHRRPQPARPVREHPGEFPRVPPSTPSSCWPQPARPVRA